MGTNRMTRALAKRRVVRSEGYFRNSMGLSFPLHYASCKMLRE
jgi:hypothetical protein